MIQASVSRPPNTFNLNNRTVYFHTLRAQLYLLFFNPIAISLSLEFIGQRA